MNRRTFLNRLATIGLFAAIFRPRLTRAQAACVLSPSQTEGPFYFDPALLRRDITEGRPGAALALRLQVVDAGSCTPIANAVVDVWHADADGLYSGYPNQGENDVDTTGETFMRGIQVTDADGMVEFATVYPGWYRGRTTHMHFKVHVDDATYVTSQLYFPDEVTAQVYQIAPYAERGQNATTNARDGVLQDDQLAALLMDVEARGSSYLATHTVGIDLPQSTTPTASPLPGTPTSSPEASATHTPAGVPGECSGDCSGDAAVTVDEVVRGVNMALGNSTESCSAMDRDANQQVTVSELVAAVNRLLNGCG